MHRIWWRIVGDDHLAAHCHQPAVGDRAIYSWPPLAVPEESRDFGYGGDTLEFQAQFRRRGKKYDVRIEIVSGF